MATLPQDRVSRTARHVAWRRQPSVDEQQLLAGFAVDAASAASGRGAAGGRTSRGCLGKRAAELQTPAERRQQAELDRMIQSPGDKATLMQITDQAFRSQRPPRAADQLIHILDVQGVPRFFSAARSHAAEGLPVVRRLSARRGDAAGRRRRCSRRRPTSSCRPSRSCCAEHLASPPRRRRADERQLPRRGAAGRGGCPARGCRRIWPALQQPEIEVISVKISTIYSQISALAREHTIDVLCDRLELLYRAAAKARFTRRDGTRRAEVRLPRHGGVPRQGAHGRRRSCGRSTGRGSNKSQAGIALQAYIPDSFATQQRITEWARHRVAAGGAPVTIRLVKGANMEMERVEASLARLAAGAVQDEARNRRQLPSACSPYGMRPENLAAVRLGIASHNLFSLAYGLVLAARAGAFDRVQFEMLEGMANHQRRALFELTRQHAALRPGLPAGRFHQRHRLPRPPARREHRPRQFPAPRLQPRSRQRRRGRQLEQQFVEAFAAMDAVERRPAPHAGPNQRVENPRPSRGLMTSSDRTAPGSAGRLAFRNEPDTDWSLAAERRLGRVDHRRLAAAPRRPAPPTCRW